MKFVIACAVNIVGNEENAGHQHFLLFPQCFQMILGKGENADNKHFHLFAQMFSSHSITNLILLVTFILSSANAFNLE